MTRQAPQRERARLAARPGPVGRALSRFFERRLDAIDTGLVAGRLEAMLPDGRFRILGGRGEGPVAQVDLRRWRALVRLARSGSVGWYEAWARGEWTSPDPVPLFDLFMRNRATLGKTARASGLARLRKRLRHALRRNSRPGARRNIMAHYDLGNDFYAAWLDPTMSYSSALFAEPISPHEPLAAAQDRKIDALLARLALKPGETLLEIGCGWGHLARRAAAAGAKVHAITLSPAQLDHARAAARGDVAPPDFALCDYRDVRGCYDAIASVEMVEAVGEAYWGGYLDVIAAQLRRGGRAALQYITIADDVFPAYANSVDFIQAYVFPGGMLLSESRFRALAEARGLIWSDAVSFGAHYAETLRRWRESFDAAFAQAALPTGFDARFADLWRYYLMYCEGGFRGGGINVAQVTLTRG